MDEADDRPRRAYGPQYAPLAETRSGMVLERMNKS
jgi:hypothetical protein